MPGISPAKILFLSFQELGVRELDAEQRARRAAKNSASLDLTLLVALIEFVAPRKNRPRD